jgi:PIN domain nuclease of toxin-antitoxin system
MILLLDTHAFLWFTQGDTRLSTTAKALLEDANNRKLLSVASCWEIAIKAGLGKLKLGEPSSTFVPNAMAKAGIEELQISVDHATAVESLPMHHRDPFDRLIVAQAIAQSLSLVSADPLLDAYGVQRLW